MATGFDQARVALGVQPETDRQLQCLECGVWYRSVAHHIVKAHDMNSSFYRERHQLPAGRRLIAEDVRRVFADKAREQYPTNTGLHTQARDAQLRGLRAAVAARLDSNTRLGTLRARQEAAPARAARAHARAAARYDDAAQAHGYTDLVGLLNACEHLRDLDVADLLGVAESTAGRLRRAARAAPHSRPEQRRATQIRRGTRRRYDDIARRAGYTDIATFLTATDQLPITETARQLGVSTSTARRLRQDPRMREPSR